MKKISWWFPAVAGSVLVMQAGVCRADGDAHTHSKPGATGTPQTAAQSTGTKAPEAVQAVAGAKAPLFKLTDTNGRLHALTNYRGRSVVLFSFCGCEWCQKVAQEWGNVQRSGKLPPAVPPAVDTGKPQTLPFVDPRLKTLVLLHGDAEFARFFALENKLQPDQTVMLPDEDEKVSETYQAVRCPRVFVIDRDGLIRYTNNEKGEASYLIPAPIIVARTVDALRQISMPVAAPQTNKPAQKKPAQAISATAAKKAPARQKQNSPKKHSH